MMRNMIKINRKRTDNKKFSNKMMKYKTKKKIELQGTHKMNNTFKDLCKSQRRIEKYKKLYLLIKIHNKKCPSGFYH